MPHTRQHSHAALYAGRCMREAVVQDRSGANAHGVAAQWRWGPNEAGEAPAVPRRTGSMPGAG
jgi:hypothetical protein